LQEIKVEILSAYTGEPALPPKYDYPAPQFPGPKLRVSDLDFKDP